MTKQEVPKDSYEGIPMSTTVPREVQDNRLHSTPQGRRNSALNQSNKHETASANRRKTVNKCRACAGCHRK